MHMKGPSGSLERFIGILKRSKVPQAIARRSVFGVATAS